MTSALDRLLRLIEWAIIALIALMAGFVFAEVVLRNGFDRSLIVTEEAVRYAMIWVAMLGSTLLVADDAHIRIDILPAALRPGPRIVVRLISHALVFAFLAVLLWTSLTIMPQVARDRTVTLGLSMAVIYASFPVGCALMMLFTLLNMRRLLAGDRRNRNDQRSGAT